MRHEESTLQIGCVRWFRYQYPKLTLFAIPNGGNRNLVTASIMKREGVLAGVADLFLAYPSKGFHGLWIEMKTTKGRQSPEQKQFQFLMECNGYEYVVCHSFDEFRSEIEKYIQDENN
jgi:hypothetical protein